MRSTSAGLSIAIHLAAVTAMAFLGARTAKNRMAEPVRLVVPLIWRSEHSGRGGGGTGSTTPPSKGRLPPPPATRIFVPPMALAAVPKLLVPAALPDAPVLLASHEQFGDPLGRAGFPSGGPGRGGGFGSACCGGIGPVNGGRYGAGGDDIAAPRVNRGHRTPPRLLYKIEPEYPDEARKARYQGTVVLAVVVEPSGRPGTIRVLRGLGLGLDERAVEALRRWRFTPALESGQPVAEPVVVEVSFRLL